MISLGEVFCYAMPVYLSEKSEPRLNPVATDYQFFYSESVNEYLVV